MEGLSLFVELVVYSQLVDILSFFRTRKLLRTILVKKI